MKSIITYRNEEYVTSGRVTIVTAIADFNFGGKKYSIPVNGNSICALDDTYDREMGSKIAREHMCNKTRRYVLKCASRALREVTKDLGGTIVALNDELAPHTDSDEQDE